MNIDNRRQGRKPRHAGFGPVLNVGPLPSEALPSSLLGARAGALVAGVALALVVLALPGGAIALAATQINPSLTARNAPIIHTPATTATTGTGQNAVADPRR